METERPTEESKICAGSIVRVRKGAEWDDDFTPAQLRRIGWPNEFHVLQVSSGLVNVRDARGKTSQERVETVILWECCRRMRNPATGQFLCPAGHRADIFECIQDDGSEPEPTRQTLVSSPIGDVVDISYYRDGDVPGLVLNLAGQTFAIRGPLAVQVGKILKDGGIL